MNDSLVTTTVKLPPDLLAALDAAAEAEDRSRSSFLRQLLRGVLTDTHPVTRIPQLAPTADSPAPALKGAASGAFHTEEPAR